MSGALARVFWSPVAWCAVALPAGRAAEAQQVRVTVDLDESRVAEAGLDAGQLERDLDEGIARNEDLHLDDLQTFVDSTAAATAISTRGMGVDYATNVDTLVVGGGVGTGTHGGNPTLTRGDGIYLPEGGFAPAVSAMVGVNLGGLGSARPRAFSRRVRLYANGMYLPLPRSRAFTGAATTFGGHIQLKLVRDRKPEPLGWGGVDLTTGIEHTAYRLELAQEAPIRIPGEVALKWRASGDYAIGAVNDAVPIELSTNGTAAFFTAYGGAALDLQLGEATGEADLRGGVRAGDVGRLGDARVQVDVAGANEPLVPRLFLGAQLRAFVVAVGGQLNVGLNDALGGHVDARLVF